MPPSRDEPIEGDGDPNRPPAPAVPEPLTAQLDRVAAVGSELLGEIAAISESSGNQFRSLSTRARTNRRLISGLVVSVALDILLSVGLFFAVGAIQDNNRRISAVTVRLDTAQTVQRKQALCPLYQVFLDSKSAAGRAAAPDPLKYDRAFVVIQQGYDALGCSALLARTP